MELRNFLKKKSDLFIKITVYTLSLCLNMRCISGSKNKRMKTPNCSTFKMHRSFNFHWSISSLHLVNFILVFVLFVLIWVSVNKRKSIQTMYFARRGRENTESYADSWLHRNQPRKQLSTGPVWFLPSQVYETLTCCLPYWMTFFFFGAKITKTPLKTQSKCWLSDYIPSKPHALTLNFISDLVTLTITVSL